MRQMVGRALLLFVASATGVVAQQPNPGGVPHERTSRTYRAVVDGMTCRQQRQVRHGEPRLECDYRVGRSLHFSIPAIGEPDVAVTFLKVDPNGDYRASVGVGSAHRCVIVMPGGPRRGSGDAAFVSPQTGKVYPSWQECAGSSSRQVAVRRTAQRVRVPGTTRRVDVRRPATQATTRRRPATVDLKTP